MKTKSDRHLSLAGLIEKLEALATELPEEPSLENLASYVEARRPFAEALAGLEVEELTSGEKRSLSTRLRKVLERDQALVTALFSLKEDVSRRLRVAASARTAARGYGSPEETARVMRKIA